MTLYCIQIDEGASNVLPGGKAGAALPCGTLVTLDANGVWQKADAIAIETAAASRLDALGVTIQAAQANEFIAPVRSARFRDSAGGLTIGAKLYLSDTAGEITTTRPAITNIIQEVGYAYKADEIFVNIVPSVDRVQDLRGISTDSTAHGTTASGRMAIKVGAATKYIHLFDD